MYSMGEFLCSMSEKCLSMGEFLHSMSEFCLPMGEFEFPSPIRVIEAHHGILLGE